MNRQGNYLFLKFKGSRVQSDFGALFDFYFDRLVRFARTITRSDELAEEAVMDVFVRIWNGRDRQQTPSNVDLYLLVAVRNSALNIIRSEKKYSFDIFNHADISLADYSPSAINDLISGDMFKALNMSVAALPPKCKIIFQLIREQGLDRREVARVLDISVKTVDNQLVIAMRKIAAELKIDISKPGKAGVLLSALLF